MRSSRYVEVGSPSKDPDRNVGLRGRMFRNSDGTMPGKSGLLDTQAGKRRGRANAAAPISGLARAAR